VGDNGQRMEWYHSRGEKVEGPVSAEVLREKVRRGELGRGVLVWREGMEQWVEVGAVAELGELVVEGVGAASVPPPLRVGVSRVVRPTSAAAVVSLVLGALGPFTCPVGFVFGIAAVVVGMVALKKIEESRGAMDGKVMAVVGIWVGSGTILVHVALFASFYFMAVR
jgi:hypothetical protein